jgi:hypothetical protein
MPEDDSMLAGTDFDRGGNCRYERPHVGSCSLSLGDGSHGRELGLGRLLARGRTPLETRSAPLLVLLGLPPSHLLLGQGDLPHLALVGQLLPLQLEELGLGKDWGGGRVPRRGAALAAGDTAGIVLEHIHKQLVVGDV